MRDMRAVGVGEGIERQRVAGARQQCGDAGHFAGEDRVPPLEELGVRDADAERGAQAPKEFGVADLAALMTLPGIVGRKPRDELGRLAAGMAGPVGQHLAEIDIEHDAAEIEQQRVGGVGGEGGSCQSFTKPDGLRQRALRCHFAAQSGA